MGRGVSFPGNIEVATVATQKFVIGIAFRATETALERSLRTSLVFRSSGASWGSCTSSLKIKKSTFKRHEGVVIVSVKV